MAIKLKLQELSVEKVTYNKDGDTFKIEYPTEDLTMKLFVDAMKQVSKEKPYDTADFFQKLKEKLSNT